MPVDHKESLGFHLLEAVFEFLEEQDESDCRVYRCRLILERADHIVRHGKEGNETLLSEVPRSIYEDDSVHFPQIGHEVLDVLHIGDVERLHVIQELSVRVLFLVSLPFLSDSLLVVTIDNECFLANRSQVIGKQRA